MYADRESQPTSTLPFGLLSAGMTVAIHQPNYLPWLGYFYKIFASDLFVFHDAVGYSRSSYTKRCNIRSAKASSDTTWLSVPVSVHPAGIPISEVGLADDQRWTKRHLRKIENTYHSAPFFDEYFGWLGDILTRAKATGKLADANILLIREISTVLGLKNDYKRSSGLNMDVKASALNLAIARKFHATHYLAGKGSANYEDRRAFENADIEIVIHDIGTWLSKNPYAQGTPEFVGGVSIIDALMHIGANGIVDLFRTFRDSSGEHA